MLKTGGTRPDDMTGGGSMQIKLDEAIGAGQAKQAASMPVSSGNTTGLKNGDVIMASVERIEGDTLMLRVSSGALLRAALQGECCYILGDAIEAAVSHSGGTCLLTILNVTRAGAQVSPENTARMITSQTLPDMLAVLSRNPGMDAATARFLASHGVADTPENIASLAQLSRGGSIGSLLGGILDVISQPDRSLLPQGGNAAETLPQQFNTPQPLMAGAETPQAAIRSEAGLPHSAAHILQPATSSASVPNTPETPIPAGGVNAMPVSVQAAGTPLEYEITQNTAAPAAQKQAQQIYKAEEVGGQMQTIVPMAVQTEAGSEQAAVQPGTMQALAQGREDAEQLVSAGAIILPDDETAVPGRDVPVASGERLPQEKLEGRLRETIRELLIHPDGETGAHIKKTVSELPQALKTLKSLLFQSDIYNKEICMKSTDQALRQTEMADKARFEHMQLPVVLQDGEYRTAELFVFRQPEKRKAAGEAGISILVALDTQHIGRVEALIKESGGSISLEFRLEQPEITETLKQSAAAIAQAAEAGGYRLTGIRFAGLEKRTTVLNADEAIPEAGRTAYGIDVTI